MKFKKTDNGEKNSRIPGGVSQNGGKTSEKNSKKSGGAGNPVGISMKNSQRRSVPTEAEVKPRKRPSFLTVFICVFLSAVIIFGAVFGIVSAVRSSRSVINGEGVYISEGVANYFASIFKVQYRGILNSNNVSGAEDSEEFWNKKDENGKTYGELFESEFREYLSEIVAGNILFNKFSKLSGADERVIEDTIANVVRDRAGGTVESFNAAAEKYGFDYDDFCEAVELQYKAETARIAIYGSDGTRLDDSLANEYLKKYTHVSLAFIRTDYTREKDSVTGEYVYKVMTDAERVGREAEIARFKGYIDNIKLGTGEIMTAATFREIVNDFEGDSDVEFYFYDGSSETAEFKLDFSSVVEVAYELENGEFGYAECNVEPNSRYQRGFEGYCFIYKTPISGTPYKDKTNTFFADFYEKASKYYYAVNLNEYKKDAEFTDRYDEVMNPLSVPENNELCIMGWAV